MVNECYPKFKESCLAPLISGTVKACLINTSNYTLNPNTDRYLSDIPSNSIISTSPTVTNVSTLLGAFNCDNITFSSVTGSLVSAIVFYIDTGNSATSPLFLYLDNVTGFPFTPNGSDVLFEKESGSNYIYQL